MAADIAQRFPQSRECFDRASSRLGYNLLAKVSQANESELKETRLSQPAIFTANVAIYRAVATLGLQPVVSAGHSFGEYCSLEISGAMVFDEALRIVNERALAMGEASDLAPGTMAAIIGLDEAGVDDLCRRARVASGARVDIGNVNSLTQIVVSGDVAGVQAACDLAKDAGAKRIRVLNVSGAWHSTLMQAAVPRFERAVRDAHLRVPAFTVVSNVTAQPYSSIEAIRGALLASVCSKVRWHEAATALVGFEPEFIIECGASEVLAPMMKRLPGVENIRVMHVGDLGGLGDLQASLGLPAA
jgi:[acyl-carrier-protein] S-malonyltransferase